MRRLEWWETDEEHAAGKHYKFIAEAKFGMAEARLIDCGMGYESQFYSEEYEENENLAIANVMRGLFWIVKDKITGLDKLWPRLCAFYHADYDSAEQETIQVEDVDSWYSRSMEALEEALKSVIPVDPFFIPEAGPQMELFG